MGLTYQSTGPGSLWKMAGVKTDSQRNIVIALAGNPNTGKSTIFNRLTGLKQHTGNWPGKTVALAQGSYSYRDSKFIVVDLPGTYSLFTNSAEEEIARDFICFGQPRVTVVVLDSTCLERNLNLALQILEITRNAVICLNLIDEAERKNIKIDVPGLANLLKVPVIETNARAGAGLGELKAAIYSMSKDDSAKSPFKINYYEQIEKALAFMEPRVKEIAGGQINARWAALRMLDGDKNILDALNRYLDFTCLPNGVWSELLRDARLSTGLDGVKIRDLIAEGIVKQAETLCTETTSFGAGQQTSLDRKIDNILTSKTWGIPIMLALLGVIFWITIKGANFPSGLLASGFEYLEVELTHVLMAWNCPAWLYGILVPGIYKTLTWVVSVMLPPMAIFFPLFALLEDLGYLPRVAFNMDNFFKKASAHGKQVLTMCMGFGCNAAGIIACRIIDSPRERLVATVTNNFVPCNGRFPLLIVLASIFIAGNTGPFQSLWAALSILAAVVLGIALTLIISRILSGTILKGMPSSFTLELPPYRKPQIGRIVIRSILDRTLFVLSRAVIVAAPAGMVIWLMANISLGDSSILNYCAAFLDPFARLLGLDGFILMAFILGLPANEIVLPILIMSYLSQGVMLEPGNLIMVRQLLLDNGWTWLTAVCMMLFVLNHWPCGTTLLTIRKETQSLKWTVLSFLIPTVTGMIVCFTVAQTARLCGLA